MQIISDPKTNVFDSHSHINNVPHSDQDIESLFDAAIGKTNYFTLANPNMPVSFVQGPDVLIALVVVDRNAARPFITRLLGKPSGKFKGTKNLLQDIFVEEYIDGGDIENDPVSRLNAILNIIGTDESSPIRIYISKGRGFSRVLSSDVLKGY